MGFEEHPSEVERLFDQAIQLSDSERLEFLSAACGDRVALRQDLETLIKAHQLAGNFMTREPPPPEWPPLAMETRLGNYELVQKIGQGGMGEVYEAKDTKLNRKVAIKLLPMKYAEDAAYLTRFQREAELLASLNHPCIAGVYGVEEHGGRKALVMELVEGATLEDRLKQGSISLEQTLEIALGIAEALEAAHAKGVIHRDLKPANIKFTSEGHVKILDFGLAKSADTTDVYISPSTTTIQPPEDTTEHTKPGMILGTAAFMSPEQACGKKIDFRTDIWSFGCLIFECLSGRRLFAAETTAEIISKVIKDTIDWSPLPDDTPAPLVWMLRNCLTRDLKRRLPSIVSARIDLDNILRDFLDGRSNPVSGLASKPGPASITALNWKVTVPLCLLCVVATWFMVGIGTRTNQQLQPDRFSEQEAHKIPLFLPPPTESDLKGLAVAHRMIDFMVLSPDGSKLAYRDQSGLWVHDMKRYVAPVLLTSRRVQEPFWAPDNRMLAYLEGSKLYVHWIDDESRVFICDLPMVRPPNHGGGQWVEDGKLLFNTGDEGIYEVYWNVKTDPKLKVPVTDKDDNFHEASGLPDNKGLIFILHRRYKSIDTILHWSETAGRKELLQIRGSVLKTPVYSSTGHIVYGRQDGEEAGVWAFEFDLESLERTSEPFRVSHEYGSVVTVSNDGMMLIGASEPDKAPMNLVWLDTQGTHSPVIPGDIPRQSINGFRPNSTGDKLVFQSRESAGSSDVWTHDLVSGISSRLTWTRDIFHLFSPFWLNDGHVTYARQNPSGFNTYIDALDGGIPSRALAPGVVAEVSRTGKYVLMHGHPRWGHFSYLEMDQEDRELIPFPEEFDDVWNPKLSHDDRWMAFVSGEQRRDDQIYITNFPDFSKRYSINSEHGGKRPMWHPDGHKLFYISKDGSYLMSVSVTGEDQMRLGVPHQELELPKNMHLGSVYTPFLYDYVPSKEAFMVVLDSGEKAAYRNTSQPQAILLFNWLKEFNPQPRGRKE
ncbi:MAG: protein kinase [Verrucomicrobiota bacterium]|nr:protein kinase [Verrucomicrobiota bacterium]